MQYIEAPHEYEPGSAPALFLAGGISDCPDWQREMKELLGDLEVVLLNPRQTNFPAPGSEAASEQIRWEFRHFRKADAMLFWFPCESLCPITLYELGTWSAYRDEKGPRPLFVGVHPEYKQRIDIEIQTSLVRPEVPVVHELPALAQRVRQWLPTFKKGR